MCATKVLSALAVLAAQGASEPLGAQRLKVGIVVQEADPTGVFQSSFAAALRSLGDVDVLSTVEDPDYVLSAVVLCTPSPCDGAVRYALALRLFEPSRKSTAQLLAQLALHPQSRSLIRDAATDSLESSIWAAMKDHELTFMTWVAEWPRDGYEQSVREFVATVDAGCFDKLRSFRRIVGDRSEPASVQYAKFQEYAATRDWFC